MSPKTPKTGPSPEDAPYLAPYAEKVRQVGPSFEALLWNNRDTQRLRFEAISDSTDLVGRTIVDAGCGRGDFASWMTAQGIEYASYIGIEAIPEMLTEARSRSIPQATLIEADFVHDPSVFQHALPQDATPEIILFSGSLNTLQQHEALPVLESAWRACTEALVFNFLSDCSGRPEATDPGDPAVRFNTRAMIAWALERAPLTSFRQDYLRGLDGLITMHKSG